MNAEKYEAQVDLFIVLLKEFDSNQRLEAFSRIGDAFCPHCGDQQPVAGNKCQCWNDE